MAYRLEIQEPVGDGVRRVMEEECAAAAAALTEGPQLDVHRARMALKRARALWRLTREGVGRRRFRAVLSDLRAASAAVAPLRERAVLQETLDSFSARHRGAEGAAVLCRTATPACGADSDETALRRARRRLASAQRRLARCDLTSVDHDVVRRGLQHAHARMSTAARRAFARPDDEAFHTLRRRVQEHWRHMLLLSRAWPDWFDARARTARRISRLLGEDHDLAALAAAAGATPGAESVIAICRAEQDGLRAEATPLVGLLLADRPRVLARRVGAYWRIAAANPAAPADAGRPGGALLTASAVGDMDAA